MAQLDETHPTVQYFAINVPEAVYKKNGLHNSRLVTVQVSCSTRVTMP